MASLNVCFFIGNLTRDPEIKYTPKGTCIAEVGIAVNRVWKDDQHQKQEEVTFLNLTAFGQTAELIEQYLFKGDAAHFQCRAKLESWDDKTTGNKRSAVKFIVEHLTFLPGGKKRESSDDQDGPPARQERRQAPPSRQAAPPARRPSQSPPPARRPPVDPDLDAPEEDDIPF